MNHGLDPSSYGDVLFEFTGIFDLVLISIPNFINGSKIFITTQGVLVQGEKEDPNTKIKETSYDIAYWDTLKVEPDAFNKSRLIPFFRTPLKSTYTIRARMNMYTKEAVEITGLNKKMVDIINSAITITKAFQEQKERDIALHIWKKLGDKRKNTAISYYKNIMSKMIIDDELSLIEYVMFGPEKDHKRIDITTEQRNKIMSKAKDMVDQKIFKYEKLKEMTSIDIANKVVQDFPEIIGKHQQFTASIATDSEDSKNNPLGMEKKKIARFGYIEPSWMNDSVKSGQGKEPAEKSRNSQSGKKRDSRTQRSEPTRRKATERTK